LLYITYGIIFFLTFYNISIGQQCVDLIITDLGVFEVIPGGGLKLIEIAANIDISEIVSSTGCEFSVADDLKEMRQVEVDES